MIREMRKKKQEITNKEELVDIIARGEVVHLAMCQEHVPYVIPMNYGYHDGCLYFHCAGEGMKIDILKKNDNVCFGIETALELSTNETPCNWSQKYRSIIGFGKAVFLETPDEKREALMIMLNHYQKNDYEIPDSKLERVTIFKVIIDGLTGKCDGN